MTMPIKPLHGEQNWDTKLNNILDYLDDKTATPGPAGPQGLKGDKGDDGATPFTIVGEYNNGGAYNYGDAVYYQGGTYVRTGNPNNPGYPPTPGEVNPSWTPIADRGSDAPSNSGSWECNFTDATGTLAGHTYTGNYNIIGNMVFFCVNVSFAGYTNLGTGQYQFDLPFPPRQTFTSRGGTLHNPTTDSKYHIASITDILTDGPSAKAKLYYTGSTTDLAWKYSTPVNWAAQNAHFDMSGFYEVA